MHVFFAILLFLFGFFYEVSGFVWMEFHVN